MHFSATNEQIRSFYLHAEKTIRYNWHELIPVRFLISLDCERPLLPSIGCLRIHSKFPFQSISAGFTRWITNRNRGRIFPSDIPKERHFITLTMVMESKKKIKTDFLCDIVRARCRWNNEKSMFCVTQSKHCAQILFADSWCSHTPHAVHIKFELLLCWCSDDK